MTDRDFQAEYDRLRAEMYEPKPDAPETTDLPGTYEEWLTFTGRPTPEAMNDRLCLRQLADVEVHQAPRKEEFIRLVRQHFDPEYDDSLCPLAVHGPPVSIGAWMFWIFVGFVAALFLLQIGYQCGLNAAETTDLVLR